MFKPLYPASALVLVDNYVSRHPLLTIPLNIVDRPKKDNSTIDNEKYLKRVLLFLTH